ncbi:MAG: TPM domain-containing protein [Chitinophagaceae bacterium]
MPIFSFTRKKDLFAYDDQQILLEAIREAEKQTSGEIRLYVENRCRYVDPLLRAAEIFWALKMDQTNERNGVLVYIALRDHQFAIFADQGIHEKAGETFWQNEVAVMKQHLVKNETIDALKRVITDIGAALKHHFPYNAATDKNELPDDIVFGH